MTATVNIPILSLFSGSGCLDLGFEGAGYDPLLALDLDAIAVQTYNLNRPQHSAAARQADLSQIDPKIVADWWEEQA